MNIINFFKKIGPGGIVLSVMLVIGIIIWIGNSLSGSSTPTPQPTKTTIIVPVPTETQTTVPTTTTEPTTDITGLQNQNTYSTKDIASAAAVIEKAAEAVCNYSVKEKDSARIQRLKTYFMPGLSVLEPNSVFPGNEWRKCETVAAYGGGVKDGNLVMYARMKEYTLSTYEATKPKDEQVTQARLEEVIYQMAKKGGVWKVVAIDNG